MTVADLFARLPAEGYAEVDVSAEFRVLQELAGRDDARVDAMVQEIHGELERQDCILREFECMPATPERYNPFAPARYFLRRRPPDHVLKGSATPAADG